MSTAVINPAKLDSVLNTCTEESMMIITRLAQNLPECAAGISICISATIAAHMRSERCISFTSQPMATGRCQPP